VTAFSSYLNQCGVVAEWMPSEEAMINTNDFRRILFHAMLQQRQTKFLEVGRSVSTSTLKDIERYIKICKSLADKSAKANAMHQRQSAQMIVRTTIIMAVTMTIIAVAIAFAIASRSGNPMATTSNGGAPNQGSDST
jgi:hypothetical protein